MALGRKPQIIFAALMVLIFALNTLASANEPIVVKAQIDTTSAIVGDELVYTVVIEGSDIPNGIKPAVSGIDGMGIELIGITSSRSMISGSSMTIVINGKVVRDDKEGKEIISFEHHLRVKKPGSYKIGPAVVRIRNQEYVSQPVTLKVGESPPPGKLTKAPADVFIYAESSAEKLWVGQVFSVTYYFYFRDDVDVKRLSHHEMPELGGFIRLDFEQPQSLRRPSQVVMDDGEVYYRLFLGRLIVFPARAGDLTIGPLKQGYLYSRSTRRRTLFSRQMDESRTQSQPIRITAHPLPGQGRPDNFSGAIGSFKVDAGLDGNSVRAGESVTMTIKVTGLGNLEGATDPVLKLPQSVESYPPEKEESSLTDQSNRRWERTYRYILVPQEAGKITLGPVRFNYFSPDSGRYKVAATRTFNIDVMPARKQARPPDDTLEQAQKITVDIRYIKPDMTSLRNRDPFIYRQGWFLVVHFFPLMILGGAVLWRKRRDRLETDTAYARRLKSRERANSRIEKARKLIGTSADDFRRELYMAVSGYFADYFDLPDIGMSPGEFIPHLKNGGVADDQVERIVNFLDECQAARFLPGDADVDEKKLLKDAKDIIKSLRSILKDTPA